MAKHNQFYKYITRNRCSDCEKYYLKELAVIDNRGVPHCPECNQKLRTKPREGKMK